MSRRSKRRRGPQAAGRARPDETGRTAEASEEASGRVGEARQTSRRLAPDWSLGVQIAFLAAVFGIVVLVAELAGAANLGVAFGVGQIAFAIAVVYLLLRR